MESSDLIPKKVFIACAGLGMGNASRVAAVVESLQSKVQLAGEKCEIHLFSWGTGHQFLDQVQKLSPDLFVIHKLLAFQGELSLLKNASTFFQNAFTIRRHLSQWKPDLLILDSDYHWPGYAGLKAKKIYIGQAEDVLRRIKKFSYHPLKLKERLNLLVREKLDFYYQQFVADFLLVPCFSPDEESTDPKIKRIPLIVRKEFVEKSYPDKFEHRVGILLSGSQLHKEKFVSLGRKNNLTIISPEAGKPNISKVEDIDAFDIVITQGGLSSISEVLSRKKNLIVVPMENHPEQMLNAMEVAAMKAGVIVKISDLDNLKNVIEQCEKLNRSAPDCTGADKASDIIMSQLFFHQEDSYAQACRTT